ncbi:hypothetical protein [Rosistilla oblonga]
MDSVNWDANEGSLRWGADARRVISRQRQLESTPPDLSSQFFG